MEIGALSVFLGTSAQSAGDGSSTNLNTCNCDDGPCECYSPSDISN